MIEPIQLKAKILKEQFRFLKQIRKLSNRALRALHDETFKSTKYRIPAKTISREECVRRLFFYTAAKACPEDSALLKRAKRILLAKPKDNILKEEEKILQLKETGYLSAENIQKLPIQEVDGYLSVLGLYIEAEPEVRRVILTKYFSEPNALRETHLNIRQRNRFVLRDLIIEHPNLSYLEFKSKFGNVMPTTTRESFNSARKKLRKAGYQLGNLRPGPQLPKIKGPTKKEYVN